MLFDLNFISDSTGFGPDIIFAPGIDFSTFQSEINTLPFGYTRLPVLSD
jgi:hypothetical protein